MTIAHLEASWPCSCLTAAGASPLATAAARRWNQEARLLARQLQQLNAQALALTQGWKND